MIRSATPSVREELANVTWGDNVAPVSPSTEQAVLDAYHSETRVRLRGSYRPGRGKKRPRIGADEIREPSERVLRVLQCVANGMGDEAIANMEDIRPEAVPHVFRVLALPKKRFLDLNDKSRDGIFAYLVQLGRVR